MIEFNLFPLLHGRIETCVLFPQPCFYECDPKERLFELQVNQGLTVYGNKGSTDQHA